MFSILKRPSAWIPVVVPLIFFAYIITYITFFGIVRNEDEGVGAHLFQFWLAIEPLMIGYFAITWLPRAPKNALVILALQIFAALAICALVFYFKL